MNYHKTAQHIITLIGATPEMIDVDLEKITSCLYFTVLPACVFYLKITAWLIVVRWTRWRALLA